MMVAWILLLLFSFFILFAFFVLIVFTKKSPNYERHESEKYFLDPNTGSKHDFPFLEKDASLSLSVIIPAYNEEKRINTMMHECMEYLTLREKNNKGFTFEVIIVDDGSTDKTTWVSLSFAQKYSIDKVRVLTLSKNRGKGGAVRMGALSARGKLILFADADGATTFSDVDKLEHSLKKINQQYKDAPAVICGSRAHLEKESIAQRSFFRNLLMHGFHFLVWFFCVQGIQDTQCGFKLFTRSASQKIFTALHVEQWAFDVDVLYIARHLKIHIAEVAVNWHEIAGSKITPFWSWLQMGKDIILISLRYKLGIWKINSKFKSS